MKIPDLLSAYFLQEKQLALPGIGVFQLDASAAPDEKGFFPTNAVQYHQKSVFQFEPSLVDFIQQETGKMKPLAQSDLESFVEESIQLLNIGKTFHLHHIGALNKNRLGQYVFTPGVLQLEKVEDPFANKKEEEISTAYRITTDKTPTIGPNVLRLIGIAGVVLAVAGGGYFLFNYLMQSGVIKNNTTQVDTTIAVPLTVTDSVASNTIQPDSSLLLNQPAKDSLQIATPSTNWAAVLLTTPNVNRANQRLNQLIGFGHQVQLARPDSFSYQIRMTISAGADTARVRDSLSKLFGTKVAIVAQ